MKNIESVLKEFDEIIEQEFLYLKKGDDGYSLVAKTVAKEEGKKAIRSSYLSLLEELGKEVEATRERYKCGACDGAKCGHTMFCNNIKTIQQIIKKKKI